MQAAISGRRTDQGECCQGEEDGDAKSGPQVAMAGHQKAFNRCFVLRNAGVGVSSSSETELEPEEMVPVFFGVDLAKFWLFF